LNNEDDLDAINLRLNKEGQKALDNRAVLSERLKLKPPVLAALEHLTEDSAAVAFAEVYAGRYVYIHGRNAWHFWNDQRWVIDEQKTIAEEVRRLVRACNVDAKKLPMRANFYKNVATICETDPLFSRINKEFDKNNYVLNCPDGTYDLLNMTKHSHTPEDCITRITSVSPDAGCSGKRFLNFMEEITCGDTELADYLQVTLGACLSGAIEEHWLMFWIGDSGRNGKNTLSDLIMDILGDYASTMSSSQLMRDKNGNHGEELGHLMGRRLVVSSEVDDGSFWAESKLKEVTGDKVINARVLYRGQISFNRTHKHLILGNFRPQLRNLDPGLRARLKIIPFNASFLGKEDPDLPDKLREEAPFVLNWLIEGHNRWLRNGKKVGSCAAVDAETRDYLNEQATPDMWFRECCERVEDDQRAISSWTKASTFYASYREWKQERGEYPITQQRFGEYITRQLHIKKATSSGVRYLEIELCAGDPDEPVPMQ
jgi:putative DNA primase/helicase